MPAKYTIKRGDTFCPQCQVRDGADPRNISGWAIASQVRTAQGALVAVLSPSDRYDGTGSFRLTSDTGTDTWPVGALRWDIQYTDAAGTIASTETITLQVIEDVTR